MRAHIKNNHIENACHFTVLAGTSVPLPLQPHSANCAVLNCSSNLTPGGALAWPVVPSAPWAGCHSSVKAGVPPWAGYSCLTLNISRALN